MPKKSEHPAPDADTAAATDTAKRPVVYIPAHLHPQNIMDVLRRLDVAIPDSLALAAVNDEPLYSAGHKFTEVKIDEAISKVDVVDQLPPPLARPGWDTEQRFPLPLDISAGGPLRLKTALLDCSILKEE